MYNCFPRNQEYSIPIAITYATAETKFPSLRTEAHGSGLDVKFGCYMFYIGNPDT
jgi:hypothetical protein